MTRVESTACECPGTICPSGECRATSEAFSYRIKEKAEDSRLQADVELVEADELEAMDFQLLQTKALYRSPTL